MVLLVDRARQFWRWFSMAPSDFAQAAQDKATATEDSNNMTTNCTPADTTLKRTLEGLSKRVKAKWAKADEEAEASPRTYEVTRLAYDGEQKRSGYRVFEVRKKVISNPIYHAQHYRPPTVEDYIVALERPNLLYDYRVDLFKELFPDHDTAEARLFECLKGPAKTVYNAAGERIDGTTV